MLVLVVSVGSVADQDTDRWTFEVNAIDPRREPGSHDGVDRSRVISSLITVLYV